jgi:hypothetical protein
MLDINFSIVTLLRNWDPKRDRERFIYRFFKRFCEVAATNDQDHDPRRSMMEYEEVRGKQGSYSIYQEHLIEEGSHVSPRRLGG